MISWARDAVQSHFVQVLFALVIMYAAGDAFASAPLFAEVMNLLALGLCAAVGFVYSPDLFAATVTRNPTRGDWLGAGISIGWLSSSMLKADGELISMGYQSVLTSEHHGFLILMQVVGATCHLVAPHAKQERIVRQASVIIGVTFGLALALGAGLFEARSLHVINPLP